MQESLSQDATLYTLGLLEAPEAQSFERHLESDPELQHLVSELREAQALVLLAEALLINRKPPARITSKLADALGGKQQERFPSNVLAALAEAGHPAPQPNEAVVFANASGLTEWVNPAFTDLCGYTLDELKGTKPGFRLQGERTEPAAALALRQAVQNRFALVQQIINYHKDGSAYRVEIDLRPVSNGFIAVERGLGNLICANR